MVRRTLVTDMLVYKVIIKNYIYVVKHKIYVRYLPHQECRLNLIESERNNGSKLIGRSLFLVLRKMNFRVLKLNKMGRSTYGLIHLCKIREDFSQMAYHIY